MASHKRKELDGPEYGQIDCLTEYEQMNCSPLLIFQL